MDSALKCLVEVDGLLCIVTLSANHTAIPCSVDNSIQLQVMYAFYVMQCRQFYTTPGNVWFLRHGITVALKKFNLFFMSETVQCRCHILHLFYIYSSNFGRMGMGIDRVPPPQYYHSLPLSLYKSLSPTAHSLLSI